MSVNNSNSESSEATDELQATGPAHGPRLGLVRAEVESGGVGVTWRSGRLRGIRQHTIELE